MLEEELCPRHARRTLLAQCLLGCNQPHVPAPMPPGGLANQSVDRRFGPERKRVEVARAPESFPGLDRIRATQEAVPKAEINLGICRIQFLRATVACQGRVEIPASLMGRRRLTQGLELSLGCGRHRRRMDGCERRAIAQVAGHAAQNHRAPRSLCQAQDALEVSCKVPVRNLPSRIVRRHVLLGKHAHPAPGTGGLLPPLPNQRFHRLPEPGALDCQRQANGQPPRNLPAKHRRRAERSHHLVVPHVDDPEIALVTDAFARNRQDRVRVDRRHRHADHLELGPGKPLRQQRLEVTAHPVGRPGISQGGRFAKQKDPARPGALLGPHHNRRRTPGQLGSKKPKAELVVLDKDLALLNAGSLEKTCRMAKSDQPQAPLDQHQRQQRQQRQRRQPEQPVSSPARPFVTPRYGRLRSASLTRGAAVRCPLPGTRPMFQWAHITSGAHAGESK